MWARITPNRTPLRRRAPPASRRVPPVQEPYPSESMPSDGYYNMGGIDGKGRGAWQSDGASGAAEACHRSGTMQHVAFGADRRRVIRAAPTERNPIRPRLQATVPHQDQQLPETGRLTFGWFPRLDL